MGHSRFPLKGSFNGDIWPLHWDIGPHKGQISWAVLGVSWALGCPIGP